MADLYVFSNDGVGCGYRWGFNTCWVNWPHDKLYWMYLCNSSLEEKCLPSYLIAASRNRSSDWNRIMSHWQVESFSSAGVAVDISTSLQEVPSSKSGPRAPQSFTPGALHMNSSSRLFSTGLVKFILIPHDLPPVSTFQKSFLLGLFSSDSLENFCMAFRFHSAYPTHGVFYRALCNPWGSGLHFISESSGRSLSHPQYGLTRCMLNKLVFVSL